MIAATMAFVVVVATLTSAGAWLVESGLRRMGVASRFVWLGALSVAPALLAARGVAALRDAAPAPAPGWAPVIELPALTLAPTGPSSGMAWLEGAALVAWLLSALGLALLVVRTHRRLRRERAGWESTQLMGRDVFLSTDRGPAVAGMWEPWIVLPRWVLALPEAELRMVLLHEEEHVRARDTRLLIAALALVATSAWNPLTWWQLRRLRSAMEVDCDRRVLSRVPDLATYGASLLTVAARAAGSSLGLAAFTERSLDLKRRILSMTAKTSRWTAAGGGVLVVLGMLVVVQSCGVETPVGGVTPDQPETAAPEARAEVPPPTGGQAEAGPTFTPFTVAPSLLNRDEVIAAMEAAYPGELRESGVGGTVRIYLFIDEEGQVTQTRLDASSGEELLDKAALKVAEAYRFSPALNKDKKVPVWISLPITFQVR